MNIKDATRLVRSIGMSVEDGLGFTVCGSQLINGEPAPDWIAEMNGWCVDEIADRIEQRKRDATRTKLGSIFTDTATLLIADPCKVLYSSDDKERSQFTWEAYVALNEDFTEKRIEIKDARGQVGALAVVVGSDGWYPVYLETDEEGNPVRLVIELGGQVEP